MARLPVLGVMTTFVTNAAQVLELVHATYGRWAALDGVEGAVTPSPATVKIVVSDAPAPLAAAAPAFRFGVPEPGRLTIDWGGGGAEADTERLESLARVTPELVSRPADLVEGVLEPLTLFLLGALDRQPLHAAAVLRGDVAVVLAGHSGAGKSTITYAASRCGFVPLADEPVYVQMDPRLRVWGRRPRIHLPVEARTHFPELRGVSPTRFLTGKTKLVIDSPGPARPYAERAALCLLRRGARPGLERVAPDVAVAELTARLDPGFDLFSDTIGARIARIAQQGAWYLSVTGSPHDAAPLLHEVADRLEAED